MFRAEHPGAVAYSGGRVLRAGQVYDLPASEVARLGFIPIDLPGHEAAAEFIAAISKPTALNPETPPAAASVLVSEPVKRARGRKPRG
jgi:hypothetical protein